MLKTINPAFSDSLAISAHIFPPPVQAFLFFLLSMLTSQSHSPEGKGVGEKSGPSMGHLLCATHTTKHAWSHPPLNLQRLFAHFTDEKTGFPRGWMICTKIFTRRIKSHTDILMTSNDSVPRRQPSSLRALFIGNNLCLPGHTAWPLLLLPLSTDEHHLTNKHQVSSTI